jgi:hypothetical protein
MLHRTLLCTAAIVALLVPLDAARAQLVSGGGETIVTGGAGFPPVPVKTNFGFAIDTTPDGKVTGTFDCFALLPHRATGNKSGLFTDNFMYVTGQITSLEVLSDDKIVFGGKATVTGLGAGLDLPFDCDVSSGPDPGEGGQGVGITSGGPGATMTLRVSGLTFNEVLTAGAIRMDRRRLRQFKRQQQR